MSEKFISSVHVQKLGSGILFDNDLARSKELISKLFHWFLLEPSSMEEVLRSYIEPHYYPHLDELDGIIEQRDEDIVVPRLECDVPLSYRTDTSSVKQFTPTIASTATPLEGRVRGEPSDERQSGANRASHLSSSNEDLITYRLTVDEDFKINEALIIYQTIFLPWQPLIEADRHVLQSVENSLKNPPQPSSILHSCEFFINVLLHDFPAEIFLQRPSIVMVRMSFFFDKLSYEFYSLMTCGSIRITNSVLNCLRDLTKALSIRINHYNDISMRNFKTDLLPQLYSICNMASSGVNRNSENDDVSSNVSEKFERIEDVLALQNCQMSVPKYCFMTVGAIFKYMSSNMASLGKQGEKQSDELIELLCLTIRIGIWDQQQNHLTLMVLKDFNEMLVQYGEGLEYLRLEYITSEGESDFSGNIKTALSNVLLDVTLGRLYSEVHNTILKYVQSYSLSDKQEPLKRYEDVKNVCQGMMATVKFLKEYKSLGAFENLRLAKQALPV
ncbi:hypothetical protein NQ317_012335 [Molorchus minor]|uniref:Uncharacterized protein n=1 Tax=Molorchus minor TaxID=1323400 RepID=A0ABQ9IS81_9CUCU|nr:hypothetical protein NQ317_012335 [Molorchus minor]